ncbi:MAG: antitoxin Xre/MbcA/ParS toxin-binding domain-containing protein [Acidobacteriota bacterium]
MKAYSSTIDLIGSESPGSDRPSATALIDLPPGSVPFASVDRLSEKLSIEPAALLALISMPERTAARRKHEGFLKSEEADRLLRVARILEEATRVFGSEPKAARWLSTGSPALYACTPLSLLDSDAGTQAVSDELGRIAFGDFA